jgi:hypothetical protein
MAPAAEKLLLKHFSSPDEVRTHPKLRVEVVRLGDTTIMRATFEPGWRWSTDLKPAVGTDSCQVPHLGYLVSGRLATRMDSGEEFVGQPGDAVLIPPGHDGWVVGDEPAVFLDFTGGAQYAR